MAEHSGLLLNLQVRVLTRGINVVRRGVSVNMSVNMSAT